MSLSNLLQELNDLLQELNVFTTQVKTNNVPALGYSTSTLLVVIKSLRHNIIPYSQGDKITISRNILAVKNDSLIIKGIPCMPKIATVVCNYNFKAVLINIKVKTCHMMLQNYNITCNLQEAGVILHMHTNILEYVTTQT